MAASETLRTRLLSSQRSFNKYIFYDQKILFLQNEYMFKKDWYFVCNTNIFCVKIYFWNGIYFFYIFIYIFLYKFFFHIKAFFSANNVYFVKITNIFSNKKKYFLNLVLQQMNNHSKQPEYLLDTAAGRIGFCEFVTILLLWIYAILAKWVLGFIKDNTFGNRTRHLSLSCWSDQIPSLANSKSLQQERQSNGRVLKFLFC